MPRWLHAWAVLTVCAVLPLVTLGAEVTTKQVGMADRQGFRMPWNLFNAPWHSMSLGLLIEHAHRLAGFVVGICCIVLALGLTVCARGWYRGLGWLALVAVCAQGILGVYRVNRHAQFGPELALVHGCFAQLVFATLVSVAVLTSRAWARPLAIPGRLRRLALLLMALLYAQIVFGATVRHLYDPIAQRVHVLTAFLVVALACWLLPAVWQAAGKDRSLRTLVGLMGLLLVLQPILGVEAWLGRFGAATLPELVPSNPVLDGVRSGHHLVGTLLFAGSVALTLLLYRPAFTAALSAVPTDRGTTRADLLEGAA
jgi:cytochrome c oxidase assembly protein subunit 15